MSERQAHGFDFQARIEKAYGIDAPTAYTSEWDIQTDSENISIKCIGIGNAVEMGSLLRFYKNNSPFTLIVGWHNNKNIVNIQKVYVDIAILSKLKGSLTIDEVTDAYNTLNIKTFPKGKHEEARAYFKEWKNSNKNKMGLLTITGKVDSNTQRRWQCNINKTNWNKLFGDIPFTEEYL